MIFLRKELFRRAPSRPVRSQGFKYTLPLMAAFILGATNAPAGDDTEKITQRASVRAKSASLLALSDGELQKKIETDVHSLGSLSVGLPNNGRLLNGVRPQEGKYFELVVPDFSWGTEETIEYLRIAVAEVHKEHADTPPLHVGHISKPGGGYLSPHLSHQSGRDVDLGFYYRSKRAWYRRPTWETFDTPRTWTLIKALITKTDVEMILIDGSLQSLLRKHAESIGEEKLWLDRVFRGSGERPAVIRHVRGHGTHLHVRFYSPTAQRNAQRVYPLLLDKALIEPVTVYTQHLVKPGETLGRLAKKYGTTVQAIQQANGLRGITIQAKKVYKIPRQGGPAAVQGPLIFPPRQLPEEPPGKTALLGERSASSGQPTAKK